MELNSFNSMSRIKVNGREYTIYNPLLIKNQYEKIKRLPYSLRILLENLLRNENGETVNKADIEHLINWDPNNSTEREISFMPARVLLQDFTGVPAVVDLAAMRDAIRDLGGDPKRINPLLPCELIIDHSIQVDSFASQDSLEINSKLEFERNRERYGLLKWAQKAFDNFRVVPPATGICHQVNLEYLGRVVFTKEHGDNTLAYPDTLVGTDSHTTMINGLGILGWGVGGIEAEAAMLGEPIGFLIPQVIGFKFSGSLPKGTTATDLVLTATKMLRDKGVVGKFVEFFGDGILSLSLADRATLSNMSPEFGSTCAIFPIDEQTIEYLKFSARSPEQISLVEKYAKETGLYRKQGDPDPLYSETLELDLSEVVPSLAGPKRPQDHVSLSRAKEKFTDSLPSMLAKKTPAPFSQNHFGTEGGDLINASTIKISESENNYDIRHGSIVIAAITSCTNTSNPSVMLGAGILAKKAREFGLERKPWVKTSLAPGSKVVSDYLISSGLMPYLEELGFNLVGYGCTTCIGNSGPLSEKIAKAIEDNNLVVCSVLSGNRNFEGRISPHCRANYLASPILVVAYALAGRMDLDIVNEPLGKDRRGKDVYLKDIWPTPQEISKAQADITKDMFIKEYSKVYEGDSRWQDLAVPQGATYAWDEASTYVKAPTFFKDISAQPPAMEDIKGLRALAVLGDTITTDHISPAGSIPQKSPAGFYLNQKGVKAEDFNSYGSRRGNHEVMIRGTFANIRIKNLMLDGVEGGYALHPSSQEPDFIYDVAEKYSESGTPLIVIAGKEYGTGSSRDWAAKGTMLLGIKAVIAESFERIHRSNLIGMGVLPLEFEKGQNYASLELSGFETFDILGIAADLKPGKKITVKAHSGNGREKSFHVTARIDTARELAYIKHGGILKFVLRKLSQS